MDRYCWYASACPQKSGRKGYRLERTLMWCTCYCGYSNAAASAPASSSTPSLAETSGALPNAPPAAPLPSGLHHSRSMRSLPAPKWKPSRWMQCRKRVLVLARRFECSLEVMTSSRLKLQACQHVSIEPARCGLSSLEEHWRGAETLIAMGTDIR